MAQDNTGDAVQPGIDSSAVWSDGAPDNAIRQMVWAEDVHGDWGMLDALVDPRPCNEFVAFAYDSMYMKEDGRYHRIWIDRGGEAV